MVKLEPQAATFIGLTFYLFDEMPEQRQQPC
jgi:hypothetical protein